MKIKSQRDFCSGLLFLLLGGVCATTAAGYRVGTSGEPGEGFFPLVLSVMLMMLGLAWFENFWQVFLGYTMTSAACLIATGFL